VFLEIEGLKSFVISSLFSLICGLRITNDSVLFYTLLLINIQLVAYEYITS